MLNLTLLTDSYGDAILSLLYEEDTTPAFLFYIPAFLFYIHVSQWIYPPIYLTMLQYVYVSLFLISISNPSQAVKLSKMLNHVTVQFYFVFHVSHNSLICNNSVST